MWSKYNDPINHNHTVEDYALFLKQHSDKFDIYFNYDEDFKEIKKDDFSSKNRDNQKYLEDAGFKPIPVLHLLDDDEVRYYLEQKSKYPFVAIGSNSISDKRFAGVVKQFYDEKVKVHVGDIMFNQCYECTYCQQSSDPYDSSDSYICTRDGCPIKLNNTAENPCHSFSRKEESDEN